MLLAAGLAVASYFLLILYDALALRYVARRLPYSRIALASFVAYAFSNNIGFALLSGGSIRYRLYSSWGLSSGEVNRIICFGVLTFGLGVLSLAGAIFLLEPLKDRKRDA